MNNPPPLPVRIIRPHEGIEAFQYNFLSLFSDWLTTKNLAWRIFVRDTQAMLRMSFLGYFWLVAPTLANTFVWVFLSSTEVVRIDSGNVPYPLFVFVGTLLWTAFNNGVISGLGLVDDAKGTLAKVNFPIESILLASFGKNLLTIAITALGLIPFLFLYTVPLTFGVLLFPLQLLLVLIFGTAIGLFFVPIAALFSDLSRAIHLGLRFLFFLSPVFYPIPLEGTSRWIMLFNPVSAMIITPRWTLLGGEQPAIGLFLLYGILGIALLLGSLVATKVALPHILERVSGT